MNTENLHTPLSKTVLTTFSVFKLYKVSKFLNNFLVEMLFAEYSSQILKILPDSSLFFVPSPSSLTLIDSLLVQ